MVSISPKTSDTPDDVPGRDLVNRADPEPAAVLSTAPGAGVSDGSPR